jgi:SnoaL-like domain
VSTAQESEIREWLDRQAIQDLIHRYSDSVTRGDFERTEDLFAPDAVWEEVGGVRFETAREFLSYLTEGSAHSELLIQAPSSPVVDFVEGGRATATTTIREIVRGVSGGPSVLGDAGIEINVDRFGIYYDEFAKFGDAWKFTQRVFAPFITSLDSVVGDLSGTRPLLPPPKR